MRKFYIYTHKMNELERGSRGSYWHHMRRFFRLYKKVTVEKEDKELEGSKEIFSGHIETVAKKKMDDLISIRFHIGNAGSETPWDGHFILFGFGFYWGFSAFRKLANFLTRCSGYKYDSRDWLFRISDSTLWWEFASHSDMCDKHRMRRGAGGSVKWRGHRRRGAINLSIAEAIWGPKRYSYEDIDSFPTTIKMPEGSYAVVLKLQKCFYGRKKVDKSKHEQSWCIDVESPKGIPTHYDRSGGWKGDRTYGFGVDFKYPKSEGWQQDAENAVTARVYDYRAKSGFREPQEQEASNG